MKFKKLFLQTQFISKLFVKRPIELSFVMVVLFSSVGNAESILSMETKVLSIEMEPFSNEIFVGLKKIESKFRIPNRNLIYACLENALKKDIEVDIEVDSQTAKILRCSP